MNKKFLKILIVVLVLAAVLVSPGWVKDITEGTPETNQEKVSFSVKGKSLENYQPLINTIKYDAMKFDQCY